MKLVVTDTYDQFRRWRHRTKTAAKDCIFVTAPYIVERYGPHGEVVLVDNWLDHPEINEITDAAVRHGIWPEEAAA